MINILSRLRVALSLAGLFVVVVALMQNDQRLMWVAIGLLLGSVVVRLLLRRAVQLLGAHAGAEPPESAPTT